MQLFFSYGHDQNVPLVDFLRKQLESDGHKVWIDQHDIKSGDDWRRAIIEGILSSESALSFASAYSVRNPGVCLNELSIAVGAKGAWVQSILIEKGVRPHANVMFKQVFDMSDWLDHVRSSAFLQWYEPWRARLLHAHGPERTAIFSEYRDEERQKKVLEALTSDTEFMSWSMPIISLIKERLRDPAVERYASEVRELREAMQPDELRHKQRSLEEEPYSGRAWLKDLMDAWMNGTNAPRILLITGGPGVGKSSFVAHELLFNERVGAAVYCEWNNPASNSSERVARAIAYQLACRFPDYRLLLLRILHREQAQESRSSDRSSATAFERYVIEPLRTGIRGSAKTVILVDGIDEVEASSREGELPEMISGYAEELPDWIRFVVTCRSNSSALQHLRGAEVLSIDARAEENAKDVREYIGLRLGKKQNDPLVDKVLVASDGVFLHASLLCDELEHGWMSEREISDVPQSLGQVYRRYFKRMFVDATGRGYEGPSTVGCHEALSALALSPEPIPRRTLGLAAGWDESRTTAFLERCAHFLVVQDECVSFSHKSMAEWLRSPGAGEYQTSDAKGWKALAIACYTQFDNGVDRMNDFELKNLVRCVQEAKNASAVFTREREQFAEALDRVLADAGFGEALLARGRACLESRQYDLVEHYAGDAISVFDHLTHGGKGEGAADGDAAKMLGEAYLLRSSALDLAVRLDDAVECCNEALRVLKRLCKKAQGRDASLQSTMGQLQMKRAYVLYRIGHDRKEVENGFWDAYRSLMTGHDVYGAAETLILLGKAYRLEGVTSKAVRCSELIEECLDLATCETQNPEFYCYVRINQGDFYLNAHEHAVAKRLLDDAVRVSSQPWVRLPTAWKAQLNLQMSYLAYRMADYANGEAYAKVALELEQEAYGEVSVEACNGLNQLGFCLMRQERTGEAVDCFDQSYRIRRRLYGEANRFTAIALRNCALGHSELGGEYLGQAKDELRQVLAIYEELFAQGQSYVYVAQTLFDLGNVYLKMGRFDEALDHATRAEEGYYAALGSVEEDAASFALCCQVKGQALAGLGRHEEARRCLEDALALFMKAYGENPEHPRIVFVRTLLAAL